MHVFELSEIPSSHKPRIYDDDARWSLVFENFNRTPEIIHNRTNNELQTKKKKRKYPKFEELKKNIDRRPREHNVADKEKSPIHFSIISLSLIMTHHHYNTFKFVS